MLSFKPLISIRYHFRNENRVPLNVSVQFSAKCSFDQQRAPRAMSGRMDLNPAVTAPESMEMMSISFSSFSYVNLEV